MKHFLFSLACLASFVLAVSGQDTGKPSAWGDWQSWGNQGDGTYMNPVLPADFSDIDCIQHDGWYYAISSTFQFSPGMVILRSRNMVDWEIYSHAVPDLTQIGPALSYDTMDRYGRGIWAGAIRYAEGRFYLYFGCPDEGMFMTSARRIKGPWEPLHKMNIDGGWDDPCPLFDDDGSKYLVATHFADGYKTYIFRMTDDGKDVDLSTAVLLNDGFGREANKLYKFAGKYYHLYSEDVDGGRYLMMQRADRPMGPYLEKHRLCRTQREWHEPNQGGYLQDRDGNWFFLTHHGMGYWGGRIASLLPVTWTGDGWPVIGEPDEEQVGNMVWRHTLPVARSAWFGRSRSARLGRSRSGDVSGKTRLDAVSGNGPERTRLKAVSGNGPERTRLKAFTSPDFEWNYQPREGFCRLSRKKLILKAFRPLEKGNLLKAGNTLTLRSWASAGNDARVQLDLSKMADGQRSGMCHFSVTWSEFGVKMDQGVRTLYSRTNDGEDQIILENVPKRLYLRSTWGLDGICRYSYSLNGSTWTDAGTHRAPHSPADSTWTDAGVQYVFQWGYYRGDRLGLYTYNDLSDTGQATFLRFRYTVSQ